MTEAAAVPAPTATLEEQAERIVRELAIPPCPAILARFAAEMNQDEPDLRHLAELIGTDIALSAAMLSTVNSPYYGLGRKAGNVRHALSILGLRACANLISKLLLRNAFPAAAGPLMQRFWEQSTQLAETAANVTAYVKTINRDEANTYALFRDCGMAVMIAKYGDYSAVLGKHAHSSGMSLLAAEDTRYRFNHARVGYALARGWLLPESLCKAILFHHDIERVAACHRDTSPANPQLVALGLLAEQVAALRAGHGLCPDWNLGESFVLDSLNLHPDQIVAMAGRESTG